jgi:hypothetical protein
VCTFLGDSCYDLTRRDKPQVPRVVNGGPRAAARTILLAADEVSKTDITMRVGMSRPTVVDWRQVSAGDIGGIVR